MYFSTILTFVATTLLAATTAQAGLFWITCNPIRLDGDNVLSATCRSDSGSDFRSVINLNTCVANNNGKLQCQSNGNYAASCTSCGLSGITMTCSCAGRQASINLGYCITNRNGALTCP